MRRKIFRHVPGFRKYRAAHNNSPSPRRFMSNHSEPENLGRNDSPWNNGEEHDSSDDSGRDLREELMFRKPRRRSPIIIPDSPKVIHARKMIRQGRDPDDSPDDSDGSNNDYRPGDFNNNSDDQDDDPIPQDPPPNYHDAYTELQNAILGGFRQMSRDRDEERRNTKKTTKIKRPFTPSSAHLWIVLMENSFSLHRIYDDRIQFEIALDNLTERQLVRLKPYLKGQSWRSLKEGIKTIYTEHSKAEKISSAHALHMDSGPQNLMNQLLDTLEISLTDLSEENSEYVKHLYINKLPHDISSQLILLPETLTIKEIARYAEKIYKNKLNVDREEVGLHNKLGKLNINNQLNDLGKAMASTMKAVKDLAEDQARMRIDIHDKNKMTKKKIESVGFTNLQNQENNFQPNNNNPNQPPQYPRNNDFAGYNNNYFGTPRQPDPRLQRNNNYNAPYASDMRYNAPFIRYNRQNNYPQQPNYRNTQNVGFNRPRNGVYNMNQRFNRPNVQNFRNWQKQASPTASWCQQHKTYGPHCYPTSCNGNNQSCNFSKTFLG